MFRQGWGRRDPHPLLFYMAFLLVLAFLAGHWVFARAVEIYTQSILIISFPGVVGTDLAQRILQMLRWAGYLGVGAGILVMGAGMALYWGALTYLQRSRRIF